jgi:hypothetical protein
MYRILIFYIIIFSILLSLEWCCGLGERKLMLMDCSLDATTCYWSAGEREEELAWRDRK